MNATDVWEVSRPEGTTLRELGGRALYQLPLGTKLRIVPNAERRSVAQPSWQYPPTPEQTGGVSVYVPVQWFHVQTATGLTGWVDKAEINLPSSDLERIRANVSASEQWYWQAVDAFTRGR